MSAILRVRQQDGTVVEIPAIVGPKGEDGAKPLMVTFETYNLEDFTADKTYMEIGNAFYGGQQVVGRTTSGIYELPLVAHEDGRFLFQANIGYNFLRLAVNSSDQVIATWGRYAEST